MNKQIYEVGMLINPDLSQQETEKTVEKIKDILTENSASVISQGEIVKIDLSYQITTKISSKNERFNEANFTWIKFESETSSIKEIKKSIDKIKKEIFRYLITKTIADDEATNKFNLDEESNDNDEVESEDKIEIKVEEIEEGDTEENKEEESKTDEVEEKEGVLGKIKNIIKK